MCWKVRLTPLPAPAPRLLGDSSHRGTGPAGSEGFTRAHPMVSSRPSDFGLARPTQTHKQHPRPPPSPTAPCSPLSQHFSVPQTQGHGGGGRVIASPQDWDFWGQSHHLLLSTSWGGGGGWFPPDLCLCDTTTALPRAFGQEPRRLQGEGVSRGLRGLGTGLEDSHPHWLCLLLSAGNPDDLQCGQGAGSTV